MVGHSFRFLHSADWHLERMPAGLTDVPDSLQELLLEGPLNAAAAVVDAGLAEAVDFVIFAGGMLDVRAAGPRGIVFFEQQLSRLAERGIPVYWAGGSVDPPVDVSDYLSLPDSVHVFPADRVAEHVHAIRGQPAARILGMSRDPRSQTNGLSAHADWSASARAGDLFAIGVAACLPTGAIHLPESRDVRYWALGGRSQRSNLAGKVPAHFPGTPQARHPHDVGAHGCTLVDVDDHGAVRTRPLHTDRFRFITENADVPAGMSAEELRLRLRERSKRLLGDAGDIALLLKWHVRTHGPLAAALRSGGLTRDLVADLRAQFAAQSPPAWTIGIDCDADESWVDPRADDDTLLGGFLSAVRQRMTDDAVPLHLERLVPARHIERGHAARFALADPARRRRVLRQAAMLCSDLLGGEEQPS